MFCFSLFSPSLSSPLVFTKEMAGAKYGFLVWFAFPRILFKRKTKKKSCIVEEKKKSVQKRPCPSDQKTKEKRYSKNKSNKSNPFSLGIFRPMYLCSSFSFDAVVQCKTKKKVQVSPNRKKANCSLPISIHMLPKPYARPNRMLKKKFGMCMSFVLCRNSQCLPAPAAAIQMDNSPKATYIYSDISHRPLLSMQSKKRGKKEKKRKRKKEKCWGNKRPCRLCSTTKCKTLLCWGDVCLWHVCKLLAQIKRGKDEIEDAHLVGNSGGTESKKRGVGIQNTAPKTKDPGARALHDRPLSRLDLGLMLAAVRLKTVRMLLNLVVLSGVSGT